jgi:glycosyltransferase involved in cell wall biosynthesis
MNRSWHILTGEYPPQPGGIADYTARLVTALTARGEEVHVWAPGRPLPRGFAPSGLRAIGCGLAATRARGREPIVLLQYAPNAFGMRGANLLLCLWLLFRTWRHGDDVRVMFHEPFFYFARQSVRRNALALVQRVMAALLLASSRIAYVSTPSWAPLLARYAPRRRTFVWLPIPATVLPSDDLAAVARARQAAAPSEGAIVVGHFSSYPDDVSRQVAPVLGGLLAASENASALLIGRDSDRFRERFCASFPGHDARVRATGELIPSEVAHHLRACDLLVQPYPDGATSRRTSLMAALACGVPTVTTLGPLSEPLWQSAADALELAPADNRADIVARCLHLTTAPARRAAMGTAARAFYDRNFSIDRTLRIVAGARADEPSVLIGVHAYPAPGEAARRQRDALCALASLERVYRANAQFASTAAHLVEAERFETMRVLTQDSTIVTRRTGVRKAIASEVFDVLARRALEEGCPYFAYVNADAALSQRAVDRIAAGGADAYVFARTDVGGDLPPEILIAGVDAFAVNAHWWIANGRRFRPYVLGDPVWDKVYAAQLACHAGASFVYEVGALTHERHERRWEGSPFASYVRYLSALDAPYFSLWCRFHSRLEADVAMGRGHARASIIAAETFVWRPSVVARAVQASRRLKGWVRYVAAAT